MTRSTLAAATLLLAAASLHAQTTAGPLPEWRRSGVCYEVFVRSFQDSDGDGVGDIRGLISRLDYINDGDSTTSDDLGATCIWLMPVAQSPSYHGYDVTNYYEVNREYGTNEDFRELMREARRRGIHVIVDLVLNHMSSEHPYFKSALLDPASPYRDWFIWSPTVRPAPGWTAPVWHQVPGREEFYYGLFWGGMPDINLANRDATAKLQDVARFWLQEMGVDGFRIDAVGHFFEGPAGEWKHDPAVHPWLRDYAAYIRGIAPTAFTVGEVWDNIDNILPYYPDQLDNYFIFEVADAIVHAVRDGEGAALLAAVERAGRVFPDGRWSPFVRNHDQTRTMHEFGGDVPSARLAATLLLTLPGFPFLYYGEELGMSADKPDPRLRTPMHWSRDRAAGFTTGVPWEPLQPDSFTANVAAQHGDPASLLNHHRRLIRVRAAHPALGATASFVPLSTNRPGTIAYLRAHEGSTVVVLANLGAEPVRGVTISGPAAALPAGRHAVRSLLDDRQAGTLRVAGSGAVSGWSPVPQLGPREAVILLMTRN